ncbi:MAG: hypothetical protein V3U52_07720, partial [Thermoplasmata archaeon]
GFPLGRGDGAQPSGTTDQTAGFVNGKVAGPWIGETGMSEEPDEKRGITRRTLLKIGAVVGAGSAAGIGGYAAFKSFIAPTQPFREVRDTFFYVEPIDVELPVWYVDEGLVGEEARKSHFESGRGANVLWRVEVERGRAIPSTGFPALLIQMDENDLEFPEGYPAEEFVIQGLFAVFDCCTHACCRPGWQLISRSSFRRDLGHDTIYCFCHDSQYNPRRILEYQHPLPPSASGAEYIGVAREAGPANRGMPLIPIELDGDKIMGRMKNPDWYRYLDFNREISV